MHMIQVIQINRTNNKGNKKKQNKWGEEKKGGNTMNGNRTKIIIF